MGASAPSQEGLKGWGPLERGPAPAGWAQPVKTCAVQMVPSESTQTPTPKWV